MSYSFVRLYLSKCDVCVLIDMVILTFNVFYAHNGEWVLYFMILYPFTIISIIFQNFRPEFMKIFISLRENITIKLWFEVKTQVIFIEQDNNQRVLVVHYFLNFTAYKAASGGVFLRCGTLSLGYNCTS